MAEKSEDKKKEGRKEGKDNQPADKTELNEKRDHMERMMNILSNKVKLL